VALTGQAVGSVFQPISKVSECVHVRVRQADGRFGVTPRLRPHS
jgi:hypothetical protein